jgi:hypothetical protein
LVFREINLVVTRYSDADWTGNADDRKSTSGGFFMWGIISWLG